MFTKDRRSTRLRTVALCCSLLAACAPAADEQEDVVSSKADRSDAYEAFKRAHVRYSSALGQFVVEDDITLDSEQEVHDYFENSFPSPSALTSEVNAGVVSRWTYAQKRDLSYCVSRDFSTNYEAVWVAMQAAAAAWENVADVRFIYKSDQDTNCHSGNQNVVFNVVPTNPDPELQETGFALAFFPHRPRSARQLFINYAGVNREAPRTMTAILTHELGHVLGFRHEHIHGSTSGSCAEREDTTWQLQTPYDGRSVMHYPQCPGSTNPNDLAISQFDIQGVIRVYDSPTNVFGAGGALYARRMGEGFLFKRVGSAWRRVVDQLGSPLRAQTFVGASNGFYMLPFGGGAVYFYPASSNEVHPGAVTVGGKAGQIFACPGNTICATNPDNGDVHRYSGTPNQWARIGGPGKRFAMGGDRLYGISPGGNELWSLANGENFWRRRLGPGAELHDIYPNSGAEDFAYVRVGFDLYRFFAGSGSSVEPYNAGVHVQGLTAQFESGWSRLVGLSLPKTEIGGYDKATNSWRRLVVGNFARIYPANGTLYFTDSSFNIYQYSDTAPQLTNLGRP